MRKRVIPVLLLDSRRRLVKTVRFGERTYIGDPFNVVRLFNEKEVDEICVLDIDATREGRAPDQGFLAELCSECFMPMAYGGGISEPRHCETLNRAGIEKFVLGRGALDAALVQALVSSLGSQAVAACIDVARREGRTLCFTHSGSRPTGLDPLAFGQRLQEQGVGEILLQSIDQDGLRSGYDLPLIDQVSHALSVPVVALGGAGEVQHLAEGLRHGASAVASGSAFTFIGRLRAVLVSYPEPGVVDRLAEGMA